MSGRVLLPLPLRDFDVTEVVVPWDALRSSGHEVVFATVDGTPAQCDPRLLTGVIFGQLGARPENVERYHSLERCREFTSPLRFDDVDAADYEALLLPGGHAKGMIPYLESIPLQRKVRAFFEQDRLVAAICHGPIVLARTRYADGRRVLEGRTVTALPRRMELAAWAATAWKLGDYYRTYPKPVEDEVRDALGPGGRFLRGPLFASYDAPFVVEDGNLLTARWPGDASGFAERLVERLRARASEAAPRRPRP